MSIVSGYGSYCLNTIYLNGTRVLVISFTPLRKADLPFAHFHDTYKLLTTLFSNHMHLIRP